MIPPQHGQRLRHLESPGDVPERGVEHPPPAEALRPGDRHDHRLLDRDLVPVGGVLGGLIEPVPRGGSPGEAGGGQHGHPRVDVHVVLLGGDGEVRQPRRDGAGRRADPHAVAGLVPAGMGDPLPAGHELVLHLDPEGVAHAAVPAADAGAGADGGGERGERAAGEGRPGVAHRPHRHDQVEGAQPGLVGEGVQGVGDLHLGAGGAQLAGGVVARLHRRVPRPAAAHDQHPGRRGGAHAGRSASASNSATRSRQTSRLARQKSTEVTSMPKRRPRSAAPSRPVEDSRSS